jgi:rhamnosyltransferase
MKDLKSSSLRRNEMPEPPARKNICAVVVTCNPGGSLIRLLNSIESQVDHIIIVDNNSPGETITEISEYSRFRSISIIRNGSNEGIARALNQGMEMADASGYKWCLTFDQDTIPFSNMVELIRNVYDSYPGRGRIGAIGVNFSKGVNRNYHNAFKGLSYAVRDYLITSGCMIRMEAFLGAGRFREEFFIDNVDIDFSLRLRKAGWINLISAESGMSHTVGEPVFKKILGFKITSSGHNSLRRYYMSRNHVIMTRNYLASFPYFIARLNFFYLLSVLGFLIAESDRRSKLASSIRGLRDGLKMKLDRE